MLLERGILSPLSCSGYKNYSKQTLWSAIQERLIKNLIWYKKGTCIISKYPGLIPIWEKMFAIFEVLQWPWLCLLLSLERQYLPLYNAPKHCYMDLISRILNPQTVLDHISIVVGWVLFQHWPEMRFHSWSILNSP